MQEMNEAKKGNGIGLKFLVCSASIVVLLAGLKAAQSLISPFLLAVFFALVLMPPLRWLKQKGCSGPIAILVLSIVVFLFGFAIVGILSSSLTSFAKRLPQYQKKLSTTLEDADAWIAKIQDKLTSFEDVFIPPPNSTNPVDYKTNDRDFPLPFDQTDPVDSGDELQAVDSDPTATDRNVAESEPFSLMNIVQLNSLMEYVHRAVMETLNIATVSFLIAVMVIFMLIEASLMPDKVRAAFHGRDLSNEYFKRIADDTWKYTKIKTIISLLTGLATTVGLWFLGVEYALLWGLLMFFLNYIPNIGPIIASIPPILLAFVDQGLSMSITVTFWLIIVNFAFGYGVEPRWLGQGLGLSDLVVLLSLIFWGWLIGPIGMFLSAPLTMVLKIILQNDSNTQWIATLISDRPPAESN